MYSNEIRKQAIDLHARGTPVTVICSRLQSCCRIVLCINKEGSFSEVFYPTKKAVVKAVDEYVEFYNDYRPHQRLGYLTPNKVEDEYYSQNKTMAISI